MSSGDVFDGAIITMAAPVIRGAAAVAAAEHEVPITPTTSSSATMRWAAACPPSLEQELVEAGAHVHGEAVDRAEVGYREFHAPLVGDAEVGDVAGDGVEGADLHGRRRRAPPPPPSEPSPRWSAFGGMGRVAASAACGGSQRRGQHRAPQG